MSDNMWHQNWVAANKELSDYRNKCREQQSEIEHLNTVINTQSHELDLLRALSEVNMALKQGAKIHRLEEALELCKKQRDDEYLAEGRLFPTLKKYNDDLDAILKGGGGE